MSTVLGGDRRLRNPGWQPQATPGTGRVSFLCRSTPQGAYPTTEDAVALVRVHCIRFL